MEKDDVEGFFNTFKRTITALRFKGPELSGKAPAGNDRQCQQQMYTEGTEDTYQFRLMVRIAEAIHTINKMDQGCSGVDEIHR